MSIMNFIMYLFTMTVLFFLKNMYAFLSLCQFANNMITIRIMLEFKKGILDDDKMYAQIEKSEKQPQKKMLLEQDVANDVRG